MKHPRSLEHLCCLPFPFCSAVSRTWSLAPSVFTWLCSTAASVPSSSRVHQLCGRSALTVSELMPMLWKNNPPQSPQSLQSCSVLEQQSSRSAGSGSNPGAGREGREGGAEQVWKAFKLNSATLAHTFLQQPTAQQTSPQEA